MCESRLLLLPRGGALRKFLTGVCRPQNEKPTLLYGKLVEKYTLIYGIYFKNIPLSTENILNEYIQAIQSTIANMLVIYISSIGRSVLFSGSNG